MGLSWDSLGNMVGMLWELVEMFCRRGNCWEYCGNETVLRRKGEEFVLIFQKIKLKIVMIWREIFYWAGQIL